jgi:transcriptional regulator with XRE-family HTH domain
MYECCNIWHSSENSIFPGLVCLKISGKSIIIDIDTETKERSKCTISEINLKNSENVKVFSEFLGISQNYLSEIETGRHVPSLKQISNMAIKMNTTIAKLLGEKSA